MGESCMFDRFRECQRECPYCSRYSPHYRCKFCNSDENDLYETEIGHVCGDCLPELGNKDALDEFLSENGEQYRKFLKEWYSEGRVECD
ncbi:MAG: hypothetical protein NC253_11105 [Ruminococcus sp.]|nr:hypothetical protein [Ruminococcus sp.]MCM1380305.1 hypothetical protein [Muribaculaceae bacterium]MCM1478285.1 hypothetical protein [Muribaculaceae bacterium]